MISAPRNQAMMKAMVDKSRRTKTNESPEGRKKNAHFTWKQCFFFVLTKRTISMLSCGTVCLGVCACLVSFFSEEICKYLTMFWLCISHFMLVVVDFLFFSTSYIYTAQLFFRSLDKNISKMKMQEEGEKIFHCRWKASSVCCYWLFESIAYSLGKIMNLIYSI